MKENTTIKEVTDNGDYFTIETEERCCFGFSKTHGVTPKAGDAIIVHTKNGSTIRGIDLNGKKIFYKTDEDLEKEHKEWCDNNKKEKEAKFIEDKASLDASYNALPKCFKERIDKFRTNNPNFRVEYEGYEMFCCEEAIVIAKACKTAKGLREFQDMKHAEQVKFIPELSKEHSGNTFGASCSLAFWYLILPENVTKMHGALANLVGSEEYGCVPKKK